MSTNLKQKQTNPSTLLRIVHRKEEKQQKVCFNPEGIKFVNDFAKWHIQGIQEIVERLRNLQTNQRKEDLEFLIYYANSYEKIINDYCSFAEYRTEFNKLETFIMNNKASVII